MTQFTLKLEDISKISSFIKEQVNNEDCIILLQGDLASGKTTLVKNFVEMMGIKDLVTSPTFSIQTVYSNIIYHYDIYNKSLEEFISLGLLEEFEKEGLHFVEWGDNRLKELLNSYGFHTITIEIEKLNDKRRYTVDA